MARPLHSTAAAADDSDNAPVYAGMIPLVGALTRGEVRVGCVDFCRLAYYLLMERSNSSRAFRCNVHRDASTMFEPPTTLAANCLYVGKERPRAVNALPLASGGGQWLFKWHHEPHGSVREPAYLGITARGVARLTLAQWQVDVMRTANEEIDALSTDQRTTVRALFDLAGRWRVFTGDEMRAALAQPSVVLPLLPGQTFVPTKTVQLRR
jgi:hypothetical protein